MCFSLSLSTCNAKSWSTADPSSVAVFRQYDQSSCSPCTSAIPLALLIRGTKDGVQLASQSQLFSPAVVLDSSCFRCWSRAVADELEQLVVERKFLANAEAASVIAIHVSGQRLVGRPVLLGSEGHTFILSCFLRSTYGIAQGAGFTLASDTGE